MPTKRNPLNLNPLQLKTLTILQELATLEEAAERDPATGAVKLTALPHAHGDHFHVGRQMVASADATGLSNPGVWAALERKGLVRTNFPDDVTVTPEGLNYDTGMHGAILHDGGH